MGGTLTTVDTVTNPFRFAAREYDTETGLYFLRSRYYDPAIGRFISEDPIGFTGGINLYAYSGNDPVSNRDSYGACPEGEPARDGVLAEVVVCEDPWPFSTSRRNGATRNFLNSNARGGSAGRGGGTGGAGYCGYSCAKAPPPAPPQQNPPQVCSYGDFALIGTDVGTGSAHLGGYLIPLAYDSNEGWFTGGLAEAGLFAWSAGGEFGFNWSQRKWTGSGLGLGGAEAKIPGTRAGLGVVGAGAFADHHGNVGGYLTVDGFGGGAYVNYTCSSGASRDW